MKKVLCKGLSGFSLPRLPVVGTSDDGCEREIDNAHDKGIQKTCDPALSKAPARRSQSLLCLSMMSLIFAGAGRPETRISTPPWPALEIPIAPTPNILWNMVWLTWTFLTSEW